MDRFFRGLLAGLAGGVLMNVWSLFSYHVLHFTERRFLDWTSVILFGNLPKDSFQAVYAQAMHFIWVGLLGVIYAYLIPSITSRGFLFKGAFYGLTSGFVIYAIPRLFKVYPTSL